MPSSVQEEKGTPSIIPRKQTDGRKFLRQHGTHHSDGGGSRGSSAEAWLEVRSQAGSFVAVCGEHHRDLIHVRRGNADDELWEKYAGEKTEA